MLPQNEIKEKMNELAKIICYEYDDMGRLTRTMHCEVIVRKAGGGRNRDNYSNGQLVALGNSILKGIVAEELFDKGKSLSEVDNHKNRSQDYMTLFRVDMASRVYAYEYGDHVFYDAFMHPPLPAHDLYIEAVVGAIYKDKGLGYTRRCAKEFFAKYGYELGKDPIYVNLTNKELTEYNTMNSWNQSTSYANNIKVYNLGLNKEQKEKLYAMSEIGREHYTSVGVYHNQDENAKENYGICVDCFDLAKSTEC